MKSKEKDVNIDEVANWAKGHSGVLLSDNVAEKIAGLMEKDAPALN